MSLTTKYFGPTDLFAFVLASRRRDAGVGLVEAPGDGLVLLGDPPGVHVVPGALLGQLLRDHRVDALLK